ncbi:MAG: CRISPR-associated helicase Cas3', partial [bacterium]
MIAKRVVHNDTVYYQSLVGHIEDGLRLLKAYLEKKGHVARQFCKRWQIDSELFYKNLFLTVALHDIGKLTVEFQNNIKQDKRSHRYPHPFFGLPILGGIAFDEIEGLPLFIFAILGHHTQLHRMIYQSGKIANRVNYEEKEIRHFVNRVVEILFNKLGFSSFCSMPALNVKWWEEMNETTISDKFILPYVRMAKLGDYKVKSTFTYLFAILQLCDDYSSAHFHQYIEKHSPSKTDFDSVLTNVEDFVYDLDLPKEEFKRTLFKGYSLYDFQNKLAEKAAKFSFLYAPCGRGKTEASLMWAYQVKTDMNRERIIFALPTQVTCNAMYTRLVDDYELGEKNVGLFHGKSLIALKDRHFQFDEEEDEQKDEIDFKAHDLLRNEQFKGNVFFKPITVTTIDHLIYAFVHGFSQADFACGNLQNAVIIFDEVHYYEQHTLNILMRLFQILRKMDIPHLLMTGTAPQFILDEVEKNYAIVTDQEGLSFQPFILQKQNEQTILNSDSVFESILQDYKANKNIFVILNQVEWAQNFYSDLKEYLEFMDLEPAMILYHSRFIHRDRVKKEREIKELVRKKPCILVATQVIEISL